MFESLKRRRIVIGSAIYCAVASLGPLPKAPYRTQEILRQFRVSHPHEGILIDRIPSPPRCICWVINMNFGKFVGRSCSTISLR